MEEMNVLNNYGGLGGNRRWWKGVKVTYVEKNEKIAAAYSKMFPDDEIIIADAHEYLHDNFSRFDFIWNSPPCQSHSKMVKATRHDVRKYPSMELYQEIILLREHFKGRWVVENVIPYYEPLIKPTARIGRHLFWSNFEIHLIHEVENAPNFIKADSPQEIEALKKWLGVSYEGNIYYEGNHSPGQVLRNCVHPDIGLHVFNESKRTGLFTF